MRSATRAVPWLLAGCLAACSPSVDYDGTQYRCDESGLCPEGFDCVGGLCVSDRGFPDAGDDGDDDDDDYIDARGDDPTMLRAASQPEIDIPDDVDQGVWDAVGIDTDCTISDITVEIDITHEWPADLAIELRGPMDTQVLLQEPGGEGSGDDIIGTYPTTLTPDESLQAFVGEQTAGAWILRVADVSDDDVGTLHRWAVNLWCQ